MLPDLHGHVLEVLPSLGDHVLELEDGAFGVRLRVVLAAPQVGGLHVREDVPPADTSTGG